MKASTPTARNATPKSSARLCARVRWLLMSPPWVGLSADSQSPGVRFGGELVLLATALPEL
jgi:hypothetical protein